MVGCERVGVVRRGGAVRVDPEKVGNDAVDAVECLDQGFQRGIENAGVVDVQVGHLSRKLVPVFRPPFRRGAVQHWPNPDVGAEVDPAYAGRGRHLRNRLPRPRCRNLQLPGGRCVEVLIVRNGSPCERRVGREAGIYIECAARPALFVEHPYGRAAELRAIVNAGNGFYRSVNAFQGNGGLEN